MDNNFIVDFLNFRIKVSPLIIKGLYILGTIFITLTGIGMLFQVNFWLGLVIVIVGNLFWRVFCETLIILFSIHAELVRMSRPKF